LSRAFRKRWKELLAARSDHYRRLPSAHRDEFHRQTQVFLAEKRITGVEMHVPDEMRLLVAASAVMLSLGWPAYTWDQLAEVLVYPENFDRDYKFGGTDFSGQAHPWGIVILSAPALLRSFERTDESYHVGFHEFAHLLDLARTRFDGIPPHLPEDSIQEWLMIVHMEEERMLRGDSVLDPYGLHGLRDSLDPKQLNPVEFFAVAVEAFLQTPVVLASRHGDLYAFLSSYFCQDPAAWTNSSREL
jgi:Mlc titration factor MtfA (ptsG expression regulator)